MTFDLQPTLIGTSVSLRPLADSDFDALFAVASDPQIWAQHPAHDRWQASVFRRLFDESMASGGALVVLENSSSRLIGSSRYKLAAANATSVEIGWTWLARSHWGGPTNAQIKRLMLDHAFQFVERVTFRVGEDNRRSRRAMEKIGAQLTDERDIVTFPDGRVIGHVIFEMRRDRWMTRA
jgi:RimJ/RimL family protein N-acetyltransferase